MRRINKLASCFLITIIMAGCNTLEAQPTYSASVDTPSTGRTETTPVATLSPTRTEGTPALIETAVVSEDRTHDVGSGAILSNEVKSDIESGRYASQVDELNAWIDYWVANRRIGPKVAQGFIEDQNHQALPVIDTGNSVLTPPLVNGIAAYTGAPDAGVPLMQRYDAFEVEKVMTYEQAIDANYDTQMAKVLDGSTIKYLGGQFTRVKNGEIVAYIDQATGKWVKERVDFSICQSVLEAENCNATEGDLDYLDWVMRHDNDPFDLEQVVFRQLGEAPIIINGEVIASHMTILFPEGGNEDQFYKDLNKRFIRTVTWATSHALNPDGYPIRVMKFIDPKHHVAYAFMVGAPMPPLSDYDIKASFLFPMITETKWNSVSEDETKVLREYIIANEIPKELQGMILISQ